MEGAGVVIWGPPQLDEWDWGSGDLWSYCLHAEMRLAVVIVF